LASRITTISKTPTVPNTWMRSKVDSLVRAAAPAGMLS
jgi:hypothetical protein